VVPFADIVSTSKSSSKIHEQVLEIKRYPTEGQSGEIPLQNEFLWHIALEVHLRIDSIHARIDILVQIAVQSLFALLYTETEYAKINVGGPADFGELSQQRFRVGDEGGHVG
jgi:hypothetical protein